MKRLILLTALLCAGAIASPARTETPAEAVKHPLPPVLDFRAIDRRVNPCVDFYEYACGAWREATPVPADQSEWWRYNDLDEHTEGMLAEILIDAASGRGRKDENERKIGDYYASCLNEKAIEATGLKPFLPELTRIAALKDKRELAAEIGHMHVLGVQPLFWFSSAQDYTDGKTMIAEADQGGFALPDRDYYLTDEFSGELAAYRLHLKRMFLLLGDSTKKAEAETRAVMSIETALAKAAMDAVERREPKNIHHKMPLAMFEKLTPSFDWGTYLKTIGAPSFVQLDAADPGFFQGIDAPLRSIPLADWKSYLRWTLINGLVIAAPKALIDEDFAFFGTVLQGQSEIEERWQRCVDATDAQLGDALGKVYVERVFSPKAKQRVLAMIGLVEQAMQNDIKTLPWMSETTKRRALEKLSHVARKVGYPEKWDDYASLKIARGDFLGNVERASAFELAHELNRIGKKVDRTAWSMTPPTNNAYYDTELNDINFPAGVLQPPNYDMKADDAANYGNLGSLIGHELTHGFDDEGRHYDANGALRDWWTKTDAKAFEARAAAFAAQYSQYVAVDDPNGKSIHVNGRLTLGENTADNGGLRLAYTAFLTTPGAKGGKDAHGFTPAQRFFLSYAQGWCVNSTEASAKEAAQTDEHAPGKFRVNGVLVNMEPFRKAFACKVGTPMAPAKMNGVW
jgi:putative endopeptidase